MIKTLALVAALTVPVLAHAQEYKGATGMVPLQSIRGSDNTCIIFDVHTSSGNVVTFAVDPKFDAWKLTLITARTLAGLPLTVVTANDYNPPLQPYFYPTTLPCPSGYTNGILGTADVTFAAGIR